MYVAVRSSCVTFATVHLVFVVIYSNPLLQCLCILQFEVYRTLQRYVGPSIIIT